MGFFGDLPGRKARDPADPHGRKWYDMMQSGQGAEAALDIVVTFSQGKFPARSSTSRAIPPIARLGKASSLQPKRPTIPAASPPSSAMSGRPNTGATTCTATSSSATMATRPAWSSPTRRSRPSAATIRATSGNGCRTTRTRPAATCSPSPTTAI